MITEALLVANLAMLSVFAVRSVQATKAELRLREIELDEQLGIGPIEGDCRALEPGSETSSHLQTVYEIHRMLNRMKGESRPRKWSGTWTDPIPHWYWGRNSKVWIRTCRWRVCRGDIVVPGRFPKPTEPPPADIEETDDIEWLRG